LLRRLLHHASNTARYSVYYGEGRDAYDVRGRTTHEAVFNTTNGAFRCPNSQQGYSPFSTWTRGLAWALCGFAEQLEFLSTDKTVREEAAAFSKAARATADFYLENSCADGVPMWNTGGPNLHRLPKNYLDKASDPFNEYEPVEFIRSRHCRAGLIRLGNYLSNTGDKKKTAHVTGRRD